jgi:hypothetical protein
VRLLVDEVRGVVLDGGIAPDAGAHARELRPRARHGEEMLSLAREAGFREAHHVSGTVVACEVLGVVVAAGRGSRQRGLAIF